MSDIITIFFIGVMIAVYAASPSELRRSNKLPTIITTIGILGTFVGIAVGLYRFDVDNVLGSIPNLLGGLKIAFYTSIAGITFAIAIKLYNEYLAGKEGAEVGPGEATADTVADLLREQNEVLARNLENIEKSLVGDGETTVNTQLQKIRTTLIDKSDEQRVVFDSKFQELIVEFREFATTMAENNTKAFIEALESTIRDFNAKISEQFGENFKQLNQAVGRLLEWQESYRQQLAALIQKFDSSASSLNRINENMSQISDQINTVMELVDEMDSFLKTASVHLKALQDSIDAHAQMADKAREAFPLIEARIDDLTTGFGQAIERAIDSNQKSVNELQDATQEQLTFMSENARSVGTEATRIINSLRTQLERLMTEHSEVIANQIQRLDEELGNELKKSLSTLGSQLTSLSDKFVEDYTPLTDRLREVVEIASKGHHE